MTYTNANGTSYHPDTPAGVVEVLERSRLNTVRLRLVFDDNSVEQGYIGRRRGSLRLPLLVNTRRSHGGRTFEPQRIVRIETTRGKELLWQKGQPNE